MNTSEIERVEGRLRKNFDEGESVSSAKQMIFTVFSRQMSSL